jgi:hypothetical protein
MASDALVTREAGALAAEVFGDELQAIRNGIAPGLTDVELDFVAAVERRTGLSLFDKQFYPIKQRVKNAQGNWEEALRIQTSINGYRLIAERTGIYAGRIGPYWCGADGVWTDVWLKSDPPVAARVGVKRTDWSETLWATVRYDAFVQTDREGNPVSLWKKMPDHMLAKCFSEDTEVLTDQGFQPFNAVTGRVLQVTARGLEPTNARPFVQAYNGDMVTLDSDDLNFSVTPNHDMVTTAGKIEAGVMYERARTRAMFRIPRLVTTLKSAAPVTDTEIAISAAYLADGTDRPGRTIAVEVSRPGKVARLREIGSYIAETRRAAAGAVAVTPARTITTRLDKMRFSYPRAAVAYLCDEGKRIGRDAVLSLNRDQARLLIDTLVAFDGSTNKRTGVRRFYSSRPDHIEAFELAAVIAGYAVSQRTARWSDISAQPNYHVTISGRDDIPVVRWGREYHNPNPQTTTRKHPGLELQPNAGGRVWCVTVPSGVIVVRRHGFSMLCGNCAESQAIRAAFPNETRGIYTEEEMGQAENEERPRRATAVRPAAIAAGEIVDGKIAAPPTPARSNLHQHAQLRALADKGYPLADRLAALGVDHIESLTLEQAKELIITGRQEVRSTGVVTPSAPLPSQSEPVPAPPAERIEPWKPNAQQIALFWATGSDEGWTKDAKRETMHLLHPDKLDPARGEVSLYVLTKADYDQLIGIFEGRLVVAYTGDGAPIVREAGPEGESAQS